MVIPFDPINLFPLLSNDSVDFNEAAEHSAKVDAFLNLNIAPVEAMLLSSNNYPADQITWHQLPSRSLMTPYTEIRLLLRRLPLVLNDTIIDLGAAYGRMGFVIHQHYQHLNIRYLGYELVSERAQEANRVYQIHQIKSAQVLTQDLSSPNFQTPLAQFYFIYDYGSLLAIEKTLNDLKQIAKDHPIQVIGRGRGIRNQIDRHHPWLSQVVKPHHYLYYSIYSSNNSEDI